MTVVFQSNVFQNGVFQGPHGPVVVAPTTFVAGGTIVAHRPPHGIKYTRDDHVRLKRKRRREDLARERLLASLSELELVQRQLGEAEAEVTKLAAIFEANPTKVVYDQLEAATVRRDELALRVAELHEQETRAQEAQEQASQQATKAQADAILAEIQRQQLAGRVADLNLGAANSIAPQHIAHAMQMARMMQIAIAPQRARHEAIRLAQEQIKHDAMRIAMQRQHEFEASEDEINELIQLGMQWTNQS